MGLPLYFRPTFEIDDTLYSNEWRRYEFSFIAQDDFNYLTIGNFNDDDNTIAKEFDLSLAPFAYYLFDEICVSVDGVTCHNSVSNSNLEYQINLYPNPIVDIVYFNSISSLENSKLTISSMDGSKVYQKNISNDINSIDLSELPTGIYSLTIQKDNNFLAQEKLVKL